MNIEYAEKLEKVIKVRINKCHICDICVDHCDFGCPYNDEVLIVNMKLKEISLVFNKIVYKCSYKNKIYNILKEQIV